MSTAILRHHAITLSFLTNRRERQIDHSLKTLRIRASRRRVKQVIRNVIIKSYAHIHS
jgi:hypothetical protein